MKDIDPILCVTVCFHTVLIEFGFQGGVIQSISVLNQMQYVNVRRSVVSFVDLALPMAECVVPSRIVGQSQRPAIIADKYTTMQVVCMNSIEAIMFLSGSCCCF